MKRCFQLFLLLASCLALGCSEAPPTPEDREALIERDRAAAQAEYEQIQEARKSQ